MIGPSACGSGTKISRKITTSRGDKGVTLPYVAL